MTPTEAMVEAALDAQYEGDGWRSHEVAERRDMSAALTAALAVSGYGEVVEAPTHDALLPGQGVWIKATINEVGIKSGQPLIGVRFPGNKWVIHASVPIDAVCTSPAVSALAKVEGTTAPQVTPPWQAEVVEALRLAADMAWLDTCDVKFDSTIMFGHGGIDFDALASCRLEIHSRAGSFMVWPSQIGGKAKWSVYGGPDGSIWFEQFDTEAAAKDCAVRAVARICPDHPAVIAAAALARAKSEEGDKP